MSREQRARDMLEQWDRDYNQTPDSEITDASFATFASLGVVGSCLILLRLLRAGLRLPSYWVKGLDRVLLQMLEELDRHA